MRFDRFLIFSGILPFLALIVLSELELQSGIINYHLLLYTYSAVIVSFISGTHWGIALAMDKNKILLLQTNMITLIAWISIFLDEFFISIILIFCFLSLQYIDYKLYRSSLIQTYYYQSRRFASISVICILLIFYLLEIL